jgi:hypothetical protein
MISCRWKNEESTHSPVERVAISHQEGGAMMGGIEGIVALVVGIAVVLFVPALVWATVIAGLIQIVREKVREKHTRPERPPLPTRVGW